MVDKALTETTGLFNRKSFFIFYSVVYLISFCPLLIKSSRFWEDWYLLRPGMIEHFNSLGFFWEPLYFTFLNATGAPVWLSGVITFATFYLSGLVLFTLLERLPFLSPGERQLIALLTILAPLNFARVSQGVGARGIQYLFFVLGAWLFLRHAEKPGLGRRLVALLCLVVPLLVESLAPVYLGLLAIFCACRGDGAWIRPRFDALLRNVLRHLDFVALPFILVFGKQILFYSGAAADSEGRLPFRQIRLEGLLQSIIPSISDAFYILPKVFSLLTITGLGRWAPWCLVIAALVWLLLRRSGVAETRADDLFRRAMENAGVRFAIAFVLMVLALYPYAVVDKHVNFFDWQSRSQFSAQVVIGFFTLFLFQFVLNPRVLGAALVVLVSLFVAINNHVYFGYVADGHVQNALLARLAESDLARQGRTIYIDERGRPERTFTRRYRPHELSNMAGEVYGDHIRLVVHCNHDIFELCRKGAEKSLEHRLDPRFGFEQYGSDSLLEPEVLFRMVGSESIGLKTTLQLTWLQYTAPERYREAVKGVLELEPVPIP